jgi:hypothetical protein
VENTETSYQTQNRPSRCLETLTPYHSKPSQLYGLLKIHESDIPLRPTVSLTDIPCYALAEFLHKILSPTVGNTDSFMKSSEHFIKLIQDINLQNEDYLESSDVSLFTNVPVEGVLHDIRNRLNTDPSHQNTHRYKLKA